MMKTIETFGIKSERKICRNDLISFNIKNNEWKKHYIKNEKP